MKHSAPKKTTKIAGQKRLLKRLSVVLLCAVTVTAITAGWRFELIPIPGFLAQQETQTDSETVSSPSPDQEQAAESTAEPAPTPTPLTIDETGVARIFSDLDKDSWNKSERVEQTLDAGYHNTDFRMVSVPESDPVEPDYFNDVVFVGDSITQGLYIYDTGLPNAKFCAYKNSGPDSIVNRSTLKNVTGTEEVALDALAAYAPKAVYVMLGMNSLRGNGDERYFTYYSQMLDMFRETLGPDVPIYVESMTPTTAETGAERPALSSEYVYNINCLLATLAMEKGCYFLNVYDYMLDSTGHMDPAYAAGDGIHMNPTGYARWVECLRTHVAV